MLFAYPLYVGPGKDHVRQFLEGSLGHGDDGTLMAKRTVYFAAPELVLDDDAHGDVASLHPGVLGNGGGAHVAAGEAVVFELAYQVVLIDPDLHFRKAYVVGNRLEVVDVGVVGAEFSGGVAGDDVIFGQGGLGKVGVPGVAVLEPVFRADDGKPAGHRVVEPHVVPPPQVALAPVALGFEDDDGVGVLPVAAEDDGLGTAGAFAGLVVDDGVLGGKVLVFVAYQAIDPAEDAFALFCREGFGEEGYGDKRYEYTQ